VKARIIDLLKRSHGPSAGRHLVREVLQAEILAAMQRAGAMIPLAFHGGTALRFLYGIRRFSEDLDFALERPECAFDFRAMLHGVRRNLEQTGYQVELKVNDKRIVHSALVRFPGLLYELGLPAQRTEKLAIKIEIDTRPPAGAVLTTTVVRRHATLQLQHHDRASLLAGKSHAVLQRSYAKGRDLYDLLWYLSDPEQPSPNLEMLGNALLQSGWEGEALDEEGWRDALRTRVRELDWKRVRADVSPFLETFEEIELLSLENLLAVLGR
jgi:predicted nucleotidyltransferase component of viral defense system